MTAAARPSIGVVGAGGVGGYYGAKLARLGCDVRLVARGAHLEAIRRDGLRVFSPLGDFTVRPRADADSAAIGPVDVVFFAVKTYDNASALPLLKPLLGPESVVLTLQNGVDSAGEVAAVVGERATLAGATYIATAVEAPGVIRQTGTHRRIVFGEAFGATGVVSDRVRALADVLADADVQAEAVADARVPLWEKFIYLAPFAAFTGASRLPAGPLREDPFTRETFMEALREVERVARASGVDVSPDVVARVGPYLDGIPATTRSSLLIDLSQGKRIEIESLAGSVVRRGRAAGVPTPIMAALYAVLKPWAGGGAGV